MWSCSTRSEHLMWHWVLFIKCKWTKFWIYIGYVGAFSTGCVGGIRLEWHDWAWQQALELLRVPVAFFHIVEAHLPCRVHMQFRNKQQSYPPIEFSTSQAKHKCVKLHICLFKTSLFVKLQHLLISVIVWHHVGMIGGGYMLRRIGAWPPLSLFEL